ncbi:MAG TPA: folate-binding protein [Caulobacteraceae bacterium]
MVAALSSRAALAISGPDWRGFLQGLVSQDVETLREGEMRFGALLTPQGRLLFDLFLIGAATGCLIDCDAAATAALIERLTLYRLRAKVEIAATPIVVKALWGGPLAPAGWIADPRLPALGYRGYDAQAPLGAASVAEEVYDRHRMTCGVPGPDDWQGDRTYPIEANFDLLCGIDFKKGCFVGQETTSRMKRRGAVKSRMAPIAFEGAAPAFGSEILAGALRAGEVLSGAEAMAMAVVRLDRVQAGSLALADGRPCRVILPDWMRAALGA